MHTLLARTKRHSSDSRRGFALVEVLVGALILAVVFAGGYRAVTALAEMERETSRSIRANYLLLEAVDVVKLARDDSWSAEIASIPTGETRFVAWSGAEWGIVDTEVVLDGELYRTISFGPVYRDANDDIATVGGVLDPGTRALTVEVAWRRSSGTSTRAFSTYITDLFQN